MGLHLNLPEFRRRLSLLRWRPLLWRALDMVWVMGLPRLVEWVRRVAQVLVVQLLLLLLMVVKLVGNNLAESRKHHLPTRGRNSSRV